MVSERTMKQAWLALAVAVALAYALFASQRLGRPEPPMYDWGRGAYDALAESFLRGRLDVGDPDVDPRLKAVKADLSPHGGRTYVYWGPLPAILLYAPWRAITGSGLDDRWAAFLFLFGAWGFGSACIAGLWRRSPARVHFAAALLAMAAFAAGTLAFYMLRRSRVGEVCGAAGIFFLMGGIHWLLSWSANRSSRRGLVLAGLFFGACVVTRTVYAPAVALIVAAALLPRERAWRNVAALLGPILAWLLCAGLYNHARFGTPFETGFDLQQNDLKEKGLRAWTLPRNVYLILLRAPSFTATPPFLAPQGHDGISRALSPRSEGFIHSAFSLFWLVPYALVLAQILPRAWRRLRRPAAERAPPLDFDGTVLALGFLATLSILLLYPYVDNRYTADCLGCAVLLAASEWFAFLGGAGSPRAATRRWIVMGGLVAATTAMGAMTALM